MSLNRLVALLWVALAGCEDSVEGKYVLDKAQSNAGNNPSVGDGDETLELRRGGAAVWTRTRAGAKTIEETSTWKAADAGLSLLFEGDETTCVKDGKKLTCRRPLRDAKSTPEWVGIFKKM